MSALTFEDLAFAAQACRTQVRDDTRALELMRGYCSDETIRWYEGEIRQALDREERFKQAMQAQWAQENPHG